MRNVALAVIALVLVGGCICCNNEVVNGLEKGLEEPSTSTVTTTLAEETTTTLITETTSTETTVTSVTETTETTQTTVPSEYQTTETTLPQSGTSNIKECLGKKGIGSNDVVLLYTSSCCGTIANTVSQIGGYEFKRIEVGISITGLKKDVLDCLGISMIDAKNMQYAQFWCPASGENMVIQKSEFVGAKQRILDFAAECKQNALENE